MHFRKLYIIQEFIVFSNSSSVSPGKPTITSVVTATSCIWSLRSFTAFLYSAVVYRLFILARVSSQRSARICDNGGRAFHSLLPRTNSGVSSVGLNRPNPYSIYNIYIVNLAYKVQQPYLSQVLSIGCYMNSVSTTSLKPALRVFAPHRPPPAGRLRIGPLA